MPDEYLNIVWITTKHPPVKGGMAQSSYRLVNSLRDRGHAVTVMHLSGQPHPDPVDPPVEDRLISTDSLSSAEPERLFWHHHKRLKQALLVGFGGDRAGYYAALWARWLNTRAVVLFRGNDFDRIIHNWKKAWMTHFILEQADIVGAVTNEMVSRIKTLRTKPTVYTPNGIHADEWAVLDGDKQKADQWRRENLQSQKPVIAMFGQLKSKKGVDLALSLFASFGFRERAYLLTVGTVPGTTAEALTAGCGKSWIHVPFQKREKLPVLYAAADIVFLPSYYDGMPNVLLEAMASGCVVVASRAGAMPDVIRHEVNGFLFDTADITGAARILNQALEMTPDHRRQIRRAARETVEHTYTPDHEIRILENAITL